MTRDPDASDHLQREGYLSDAENAAEMARLMIQDRLLTQAMGGVVPEPIDLSCVSRVLDIGCGPGGWLLDLARTYPHIQGIGIDISHLMIDYATDLATTQKLSNVQFHVMDATKPLPFPDQSFDLINGRILMGFLLTQQWPALLSECARLSKPGGVLRLTDGEWGFTTSAALDRFTALSARAFALVGHSFSPAGRTFGTIPLLARFLQQAGYQDIQKRTTIVDYSAGTPIHQDNVQNLLVVYQLLQPLLVETRLAEAEELRLLHQQMTQEIQEEDFNGMDFFLTVWGRMPAREG